MKLSELKNGLDARGKVNAWLDHISEHDEAIRSEVMQQCTVDKESREYFVSRFEQDCANNA